MSAALLAKLKVKKPPKTRESVEIVLQVPAKKKDISIRTKVVDMTKNSGIDRDDFMKSIVSNKVTRQQEAKRTQPPVQREPIASKSPKRRMTLVAEESPRPTEEKPEEEKLTIKRTKRTTKKPEEGKPTEEKPEEKKLTIKRTKRTTKKTEEEKPTEG